MKYPEITHLHKFYTFNAHSLSVLINKKVWFSKPATLNDPFDIDIDFTYSISPSNFNYMIKILKSQNGISNERLEELREIEQKIPDQNALNEMSRAMNKKFRDDRKKWGVFCMCESPKNILMWSHYADRHRGFCIQFARSPKNKLGNIEMTRPVSYGCEYPSPDPYTENGMERIYDELFFTKAKGWEYEKEWRMLNEKGDIELPIPGDISSIIFGLNMPEPQRKTIKNILSDKQEINNLQAIKVKNKFELEIIEC
jgi:hypothetical protein